jgi:hypothetical protein
MLRLGAALPLHNLAPGQQVAYIQQAETSGYEGIWVPEVMGTDAFTVLAAAAQVTQRLRLGTGIVPIDTRTPTTLAMTIATLDAFPGGRACSVGVSSEIIIGRGTACLPKPCAMREAVDTSAAYSVMSVSQRRAVLPGAEPASQCARAV